MYVIKGELDIAISCYEQALDIELRIHESNPNHPNIAAIYNNFGNVFGFQKKHDQAIEYYNRALGIALKVYENINHPAISMNYYNLGRQYFMNKEYVQAINYYNQALEISFKIYMDNPTHPAIAHSYNGLGAACEKIGEYDQAIKYYMLALEIYHETYANNPQHLNVADIYHNLGSVYTSKREYVQAIKYYERELQIMLKIYILSPNHLSLASSHYNLGVVYYRKGDYANSCFCADKALSIYSAHNNQQDIIKAQNLYNSVLLQLGNSALLLDKVEEVRLYYGQINARYNDIDFASMGFVKMQSEYADIAYNSKALFAAINCQLVLLKVDHTLEYDNHYHKLACFYNSIGSIEKANEAFHNALTYSQITASLHVNYAQFLIMNADCLNIDPQEITYHLYSAIGGNEDSNLRYNEIEQNSVCNVLRDLIKEKNVPITISSKTLAYYLLITHPEYIREIDSPNGLLDSFRVHCNKLQDDIAFRLLANTYNEMISDNETTAKYTEQIYQLNLWPQFLLDEPSDEGKSVPLPMYNNQSNESKLSGDFNDKESGT